MQLLNLFSCKFSLFRIVNIDYNFFDDLEVCSCELKVDSLSLFCNVQIRKESVEGIVVGLPIERFAENPRKNQDASLYFI